MGLRLLLGAAERTRDRDSFAPFRVRHEFRQALATANAGLGAAAFEAGMARGRALAPAEVVAFAESTLP